jgi:AcrR family transcriptional regulator
VGTGWDGPQVGTTNGAAQIHAAKTKRGTAESILDAAEHLCATHGIEAVSIRDIAAAAGVSIPVIYHHYKSRTNLLREIVRVRFGEIAAEYHQLLTALEAQESPSARDIVRAVMQPINQWRRPGREASLQFYALALVCPLPEVKEALDAGVAGFHRVVTLLQRALPQLTAEEICWRLHFTIKLSQETHMDAARLAILSKGQCNHDDADEALARAIAFAEAAFLAAPFSESQQAGERRGKTKPRSRQSSRRQ